MKKTTFFLALLMLIGSAALAQRQSIPQQLLNNMSKQSRGEKWVEMYRPSTIVVQGTVEAGRYSFTYDEDGYLTRMELDYSGNNNDWEPYSESLYDYDFNGNVTEILIRDLEIDEDYSLETMTYSGDKLSVDLFQEWNGSEWVNQWKAEYNYYTDEILMVIVWDWEGGTWKADYMYTYTDSGNTLEMLCQYMEGGAWQNDERETTYYNEDGTTEKILSESWMDNQWVQYHQKSYHYVNGLYDYILESVWMSAGWTESMKSTYLYDGHGNAVSGESFTKDGSNWVPAFGNLEISYDHINGGYSVSGFSFEATYIDVTGVGEEPVAESFTFYPNPVKDVLTIKADDFQKAEVYSLTGAKIAETTSNRVDVSGLQAGMYLLKVYGMETGCNARAFVVR